MTLPLALRKATAHRARPLSFESVPTFTDKGLVLGRTVLAPLHRDGDGLAGAEPRILALLAVAYGQTVRPGILANIRRAARCWQRGDEALAAIEIALSGLPPLPDETQSAVRLSLGETLLAAGLGPRQLVELCGLDPAGFDVLKTGYNPDQPRVPAGNPDGGQWTAEDGSALSPDAPGRIGRVDPNIEFVSYTPVHGLPDDAVVVTTPDGNTIADPDSKTKKLMAPPRADYREVYAAGRAIASLPLPEQYSKGRAAIGQGGTYDFQRDVKQQKILRCLYSCCKLCGWCIHGGNGTFSASHTIFCKTIRLATFAQL